jgi:hypothetical protein
MSNTVIPNYDATWAAGVLNVAAKDVLDFAERAEGYVAVLVDGTKRVLQADGSWEVVSGPVAPATEVVTPPPPAPTQDPKANELPAINETPTEAIPPLEEDEPAPAPAKKPRRRSTKKS